MKSISKFKNISNTDIWNSENIYHLKTDITRISNLINHYEIYKKITSLPGDVVECGVFKGISLTRFLTFREILENNNSRKIYGFDVFGKFPKPKNQSDKSFLKRWEKNAGDVKKTIPNLIKQQPHLKISLLHLDMDINESTKFVLNKLFSYVVRGGIILIDDYNTVFGATKATDEFLNLNKDLEIKKLNFYKKPSYIIKI